MNDPIQFPLDSNRVCTIRLLTEDDAAEARRIFPISHGESDFLMYMPGEFDLSLEQEQAFIRERVENPRALLLCAELDGQLIALAGAQAPKYKRMAHQAELGITVLKEFWRQGLGRKLTLCIIEWANVEGLRKLTLRVFADNERAHALYRSLGFTQEGILKEDALRTDGSYSDTIVMGLRLV